MYTGPHIIKDELLFGYDTGYGVADNKTSTRFYQGEPTTNLIASNGLDFTVLSSYSNLSRSQVVDSKSPSGYACEMQITDASAINNAARVTFGQNTNIPSSGNATVSVYAKLEGGPTSNITPKIYNGSGTAWQSLSPLDGGSAYLTYKYRRFAYYGAITANPGFSMVQGNSSKQTGQKTRWHSPQVELTTQASPFVDGTRSATGSLINLGSSGDINVNNTSFDSTGQPTFDGTSDRILHDPGTFPLDFSFPFSIEVIYYVPNSAAWNPVSGRTATILARGGYAGVWGLARFTTNNRLGFYMRTGSGSNTYDPYTTIERDKYYHIVATWNGSNKATLYKNGVEVSSETASFTGTDCDNTGWLQIAGANSFSGSNGGYTVATIPVGKVFKKCLTATEVKQNFRAYKNRFNI